jgi:hypothetical protein
MRLPMTPTWLPLGAVPPTQLIDTRLAAHWAAQIVAAATIRLPASADFSHTNLGWRAAHRALMTHPIGEESIQVGLRLPELELIVTQGTTVIAAMPLPDRTMLEGLAWLQTTLDERLGATVELDVLHHRMPRHPLGAGSRFDRPNPVAYRELAHWFANAHGALLEIATSHGSMASPPRCWPHHLDIATLITLESHEDPKKARTMGVGMSPGDDEHPQPYWYVTPWPRPVDTDLPLLPLGSWHTDGWTGAILVGTAALESTDPHAHSMRFLRRAVEACEDLVVRKA